METIEKLKDKIDTTERVVKIQDEHIEVLNTEKDTLLEKINVLEKDKKGLFVIVGFLVMMNILVSLYYLTKF